MLVDIFNVAMSVSGLEVPGATGNTNNDHACAVACAIDKTEVTYTFADDSDTRGTLIVVWTEIPGGGGRENLYSTSQILHND